MICFLSSALMTFRTQFDFSKTMLKLIFDYVAYNLVKTSESSLCMRNAAIEITDSL